ncbi:MAG TPA: Gfo/Idh/MocA family oxidoreductase [Spirochaetes bacterium]|nr:Gfo/Idh/MocA family oxidoreductase [Spirochaetota bacterium]
MSSSEKTLRVGLIGAGTISYHHLQAYRKQAGVEAAAVCDLNPDRARRFAAEHGIPRFYGTAGELLEDPAIAAVSVCTWNRQHPEHAIAALEAGKHVLCEKPMAADLEGARLMLEASEKSDRLLMVGLVRRFEMKSEAARQIIGSGRLGGVYYARAWYLRRDGFPGGWFSDREKSGGGALIDIGIHTIDLVKFLTGAGRARTVYGKLFHKIGPRPGLKGTVKYASVDEAERSDVEDLSLAVITFESGLVLNVESAWSLNMKEDHSFMEIYGDRAGLRVDPALELYSDEADLLADTSFRIDPSYGTFQALFDREIEHFVDCLRTGRRCLCDAREGFEIMEIIDGIYRSARTGGVVSIG